AFRTSACGMYFVNRYRASIGRSVIGGALPSATNGSARPTNGSAELAGNVTEGNVTGGNATPRPTPQPT
ncbi:MAG TPA: hypothetical protein VGO51_10860, partial [Burkholderiaceae bacterium]|nr:hypothetical protein [Burkholderiaceae bacterium]